MGVIHSLWKYSELTQAVASNTFWLLDSRKHNWHGPQDAKHKSIIREENVRGGV